MITVAPLESAVLADLRRHYEEAATAETRTRYHMVLLAKPGQRVPQIARLVERSEDTVARVLKRFLTQGLEAVPRQSTASKRERTVTVAWESELLRVMELDPARRSVRRRRIGRPDCWRATWPRKQASKCPSRQCEPLSIPWVMCVSVPLGRVTRKAEAQVNDVGNACG
jgi:hypothetical protein